MNGGAQTGRLAAELVAGMVNLGKTVDLTGIPTGDDMGGKNAEKHT